MHLITHLFFYKRKDITITRYYCIFPVPEKKKKNLKQTDIEVKIIIYLFIYLLFTHLFKVDNDKKDTVYKNTNKIAWG